MPNKKQIAPLLAGLCPCGKKIAPISNYYCLKCLAKNGSRAASHRRRKQEQKERLINIVEERGEFGPLEDGYVYYFPLADGGALSAWQLRAIAAELDRRNAGWDGFIKTELAEMKGR